MSQTETYIILKPIAERFNKVSSEITDDEIKLIIKDVMRERIASVIHFDAITDKIDTYIEENSEAICHAVSDSISQRLDLPRDYKWYR